VMRWFFLLFVLAFLLGGGVVLAGENLSAGRTLGIGTQFTFPGVLGVSLRLWTNPSFGLEGTAFVFSGEGGLWGFLAGRALIRMADTRAVDFYIAPGASYLLGEGKLFGLGTMGIEFTPPFAPALALNAEFGFFFVQGQVGMSFGSGLHFYF